MPKSTLEYKQIAGGRSRVIAATLDGRYEATGTTKADALDHLLADLSARAETACYRWTKDGRRLAVVHALGDGAYGYTFLCPGETVSHGGSYGRRGMQEAIDDAERHLAQLDGDGTQHEQL